MRNFYKHKYYNLVASITCIAFMVVYLGCQVPEKTTTKKTEKAMRKAEKLLNKYPEVFADKYREVFPCETVKTDTVYDWQNSTVYVECPPRVDSTDTVYVKAEPIRVPCPTKIERITITKTVRDSAEVFALRDTIESLKVNLYTYKHNYENCERLRGEEKAKYESPLYLLLALILSVVGNLLQLRKRKLKK
jgi:hypothetical protein